jgi:hypothetical protein
MWWIVIIGALLVGANQGWVLGVLIVLGWLVCLHIRNLYVRRYM